MQYYFAPMEGITGYIYRNAYASVFGGIDKYFSPFIVPHKNRGFKTKELKDIFFENNRGIVLIPQILTNDAGDFLRTAEEFRQMGYEEVNLNLGCPSGTVTAKGKGAGFLGKPEELDHFLEEIYQKATVKISVKTRIGIWDREEFYDLVEIYKKYPIAELIVHPRLLQDYYKNTPDRELFKEIAREYQGTLVYNGDITTKEYYEQLIEEIPSIHGVMLGRGLLTNPGLIQEIKTQEPVKTEQIKEFHASVLKGYQEVLSGDRNVLFKMKEIWFYMIQLFEENEKYAKQIKKAQNIQEYQRVTERLFDDLTIKKGSVAK